MKVLVSKKYLLYLFLEIKLGKDYVEHFSTTSMATRFVVACGVVRMKLMNYFNIFLTMTSQNVALYLTRADHINTFVAP